MREDTILLYTKLFLLMLTIIVLVITGYIAELANQKLKSIKNYKYETNFKELQKEVF